MDPFSRLGGVALLFTAQATADASEPPSDGRGADGTTCVGSGGFVDAGAGAQVALLVHADGGTQDVLVPLLRLEQELGWHPGGGSSALALALQLAQVVGDAFDYRIASFQVGAALRWDAPVAGAVTLGPVVKVGYALIVDTRGTDDPSHAAAPLAGVELRVGVADRGILVVRPIAIEWAVNGEGAVMSVDVHVGGGMGF
jgi:hypothetical protein